MTIIDTTSVDLFILSVIDLKLDYNSKFVKRIQAKILAYSNMQDNNRHPEYSKNIEKSFKKIGTRYKKQAPFSFAE